MIYLPVRYIEILLSPGIKMNNALLLIRNAFVSIEDNDVDVLRHILNVLPIEKLSSSESTNLLEKFLEKAMEYDRDEVVPVILDTWSDIYVIDGRVSFTSMIFTLHSIQIPLLTFMIVSLGDLTFLEVIGELCYLADNDSLVISCQRVLAAFGVQGASIYKSAYQNSILLGNTAVESFLLPLVEATADYADIPSWILPDTAKDEDIYREAREMVPFDPNAIGDEEAVKVLTDGLMDSGITIDDLEGSKIALLEYLKSATERERAELLAPVAEQAHLLSLQEDKELFKIHGPANPLVGSDLSQMNAGGCRMLSCMVFDYDDENNEYVDWFTGNCEVCTLKIRTRSHALRLPYLTGGWKGCYCSFECLRERLPCDQGPIQIMLDIVETDIKEIGIRTREYVEPEDEVESQLYLAVGDNLEGDEVVYTKGAKLVYKQLPALDNVVMISSIPGSGLDRRFEDIQSTT